MGLPEQIIAASFHQLAPRAAGLVEFIHRRLEPRSIGRTPQQVQRLLPTGSEVLEVFRMGRSAHDNVVRLPFAHTERGETEPPPPAISLGPISQ